VLRWIDREAARSGGPIHSANRLDDGLADALPLRRRRERAFA
jgi:hypothetical protein